MLCLMTCPRPLSSFNVMLKLTTQTFLSCLINIKKYYALLYHIIRAPDLAAPPCSAVPILIHKNIRNARFSPPPPPQRNHTHTLGVRQNHNKHFLIKNFLARKTIKLRVF